MPLVLKRIETVLRRTKDCGDNLTILTHEEIQVDTQNYKVFVSGREVILTAREFEILRLLMENKGRVFTWDNLLNQIWNYDYFGDVKIVNTHIKNIRRKLGVDCIKTVRGVGYRIDKKD